MSDREEQGSSHKVTEEIDSNNNNNNNNNKKMTIGNAFDRKFESLYRQVFEDLSLDSEEAETLHDEFEEANPPPDKLVWLRATAFRIGCEYLTDDIDTNKQLLRTINGIVHSLEKTCMIPHPKEDTDAFDESTVNEFYTSLYSDLAIDQEENQELLTFFQITCPPPIEKFIFTRAGAFRVAVDFLSADGDKASNIQLLRCINCVVHAFEKSCLLPKPYQLRQDPPPSMAIASIGLRSSIEQAAQHLWDLDANRATPNQDYSINVQDSKKPYHKYDAAEDPLFDRVDRYLFQRPTYKSFVALLDNYCAATGKAEYMSNTERHEIQTFLTNIMQTPCMQFCHKYCVANAENAKERIPTSASGFAKLLKTIWFDLYHRSRGGRADSSGFEHVFVGEEKNGSISGFHNWIQFYLEEKKGNIDYRGYIKPKGQGGRDITNENDHILSLQFAWNGAEKFVGTSFVGVSPEFEMALYTMCFLVGEEDNYLTLDTGDDIFELNIKCFSMARGKIGTAFPEALGHYEDE